MQKRLATTDFDRRLKLQRFSRSQSPNSRRSVADRFHERLALKSSATGLRLTDLRTGCHAIFNRNLYRHPDLILPQTLKVFASWDIEVVKIDRSTKADGKITTEIQTPDCIEECQLS